PPSFVKPYRLPLPSMIRPPVGPTPSAPLNEASLVIVPLPLTSSKTVPSLDAPPVNVVSYRLPLLSMVRLPGLLPSLNEASVVIMRLPGAISKTVPRLEAPPRSVVPYKLPLLSAIRPVNGSEPSVPLNEASAKRLGVSRVSSPSRRGRKGRVWARWHSI